MVRAWAEESASADSMPAVSSALNESTHPPRYFPGIIGSGNGTGKRGGTGLEGIGHLEQDFFESMPGYAMQQPAFEFEQDGEIHLAPLIRRRKAPMVLQTLEGAFGLDDVNGARRGVQRPLAGIALAQAAIAHRHLGGQAVLAARQHPQRHDPGQEFRILLYIRHDAVHQVGRKWHDALFAMGNHARAAS